MTTLKLVPKRRFCGQRINGQVTGPITIKRYTIKFPSDNIKVPEFWSSNTMKGETPKIQWDEKVTTINQAIFRCSAHGYAGFGGGQMQVAWKFNETLIISRGGGPCNEMGNPQGTNVGAYLINGLPNTTTIEVVKNWGFVVGIENITADLEVWFQGKEPTVTYPEPEWLTYLKWGALGVGILGVAYLGIRAYEARKKK